MVRYSRYSRRYSRRPRRSSRSRRTLSKTNVLVNKSAQSQAFQINALNRKLSYIARRDRPETKTIVSTPVTSTLGNTTSLASQYKSYAMAYPIAKGPDDGQRVGDAIKVISHTIGISGTLTKNGSGTLLMMGTPVRILVVQAKTPNANSIPSLSSILELGDAENYSSHTISPLITNFTKSYRLLYDRVFFVTEDKPEFNRKIIIRPRFKTLRFGSSDTVLTGSTNVVYVYLCTSGLVQSSSSVTTYDTISFTLYSKTAYTDA